jgi:hypothetical protein
MKKLLFIGLSLILFSCTENEMARNYGGTQTINLSPNKELINITFKGEQDLWILTRNRRPGESIDTFYFHEKSNYGLMEGTIIINEK